MNKHAIDWFSLIAGVVVVSVAVVSVAMGPLSFEAARYILPIGLIALGLAGVAKGLKRGGATKS